MPDGKISISEVDNIKHLKYEILKSVKKVIEEFQDNPFLFMSEADLQARLFCLLREKTDQAIEFEYKSKTPEGEKVNTHKIDLINTEYAGYMDAEHFNYIDIVCLRPANAEKEIDEHSNDKLAQYLWRLPLLAGIELKLVRYDYNIGAEVGDTDKKKLIQVKEDPRGDDDFSWLVLCFYQNKEKVTRLDGKDTCDGKITFDQIYLIGGDKLYVRTTKKGVESDG